MGALGLAGRASSNDKDGPQAPRRRGGGPTRRVPWQCFLLVREKQRRAPGRDPSRLLSFVP